MFPCRLVTAALATVAIAPTLASAQVTTAGQVPGQPIAGQPSAEAPAQAGPIDRQFVPTARLDLPADAAAQPSPDVRTAIAIVNGDVLTNTDVDQRLKLYLLANDNPDIPPEEVGRFRAQVLRNLVDESLQIQAAEADSLKVDDGAVDAQFARFAQQFGRTPQQMAQYLASVGSSEASLKRQIRAEIAWQKVLGRRVGYFVNVSDDEVNGILDKLRASKGQTEYRLGEIYLSAPAGAEAQVAENARKIMEQLRGGGNFTVYARQFSEASTAAVGGDLGWIRPEQLPPQLARAATGLEVGQVVGPVAVPGGLSILLMIDKRQILTADPRQARLSLRQLSLSFPQGATEADVAPQVERFGREVAAINGCGSVDAVAQRLGAEVVDNDQVTAADLPPPIATMLLNMQVGQATQPFGSLENGVRALVLCGRDEAEAASMPSFDAVKNNLENTRIAQSGRRYLRDLRRDAVIEYR